MLSAFSLSSYIEKTLGVLSLLSYIFLFKSCFRFLKAVKLFFLDGLFFAIMTAFGISLLYCIKKRKSTGK